MTRLYYNRHLFIVLFALFKSVLSAQIYDLSADFDAPNTPQPSWKYGYSIGGRLAPDQFRGDAFREERGKFLFWHPESTARPGPGYYPYVAYNETDQTRLEPTRGWAARPHEIAMEASNSGQYSIVRFTVPQSATYRIEARFAGIHFNLSSTDVHVLRNTESLFDAEIDGYGGDPKYHPIEGARPTASYAGSVSLRAGDEVIFAVGYGRNRTNYNDTTGLFARLTKLPKSAAAIGKRAKGRISH